MVINDKRGWIRIAEMLVAILIISGVVLYIASGNVQDRNISGKVYEKQNEIFDVISRNENYRNEIISLNLAGDCISGVNGYDFINFIEKSLPKSWDYVVNVCEIDKLSNIGSPIDKEVFVSEMVISAVVDSYPAEKSRKVRLIVWVE